MSPQLYDIIKRVGEVMVRSHSITIRDKCSFVFCKFLLEYPMSDARLDQQIEFLVANLTYEFESGRVR